jgi:hypothetical protein
MASPSSIRERSEGAPRASGGAPGVIATSDLPFGACNGAEWAKIQAAFEGVESVRQFWRGYFVMGTLCFLLLPVEFVILVLIPALQGLG